MSSLLEKRIGELGAKLKGEKKRTRLDPNNPLLSELVESVLMKGGEPEGQGLARPTEGVSIAEVMHKEGTTVKEKTRKSWRVGGVIGILGLLGILSLGGPVLAADYYHNTHETKTVYSCLDDPEIEGTQCGEVVGNVYFEVYESSGRKHTRRAMVTDEKGVREVEVEKGAEVMISPPYLAVITDPEGNKFIYAGYATDGYSTVIVIAPMGSNEKGRVGSIIKQR